MPWRRWFSQEMGRYLTRLRGIGGALYHPGRGLQRFGWSPSLAAGSENTDCGLGYSPRPHFDFCSF